MMSLFIITILCSNIIIWIVMTQRCCIADCGWSVAKKGNYSHVIVGAVTILDLSPKKRC